MTAPTDINANRVRLLAFLRDHPGESTCDRLASDMGWDRHRTAGTLRSLKRTGHVGYNSATCYWQHRPSTTMRPLTDVVPADQDTF